MATTTIGIIADTHDNRWSTEAVLSQFAAANVSHIVHAGDYIAPFNARYFGDWAGRFTGVFGNNDGERIGLLKQYSEIGPIHVGPHPIEIGGRRFLVMHEPAALDAIGRSGDFDAIVYGHTHSVDIRAVTHATGSGETLIINPGEAGGWLNGSATAVLLNLETMEHQLIEVPLHPE